MTIGEEMIRLLDEAEEGTSDGTATVAVAMVALVGMYFGGVFIHLVHRGEGERDRIHSHSIVVQLHRHRKHGTSVHFVPDDETGR